MRKSIVLASVLFAAVASPAGAANYVTVQTLPIQTTTTTTQQMLTDQSGKPATIAGELRIPGGPDKTDRFPAIVIAPGIGGVVTPHEAWAQTFNDMGIATFTIDYFGGRGLYSIADRFPLSPLNGVVDAYRALSLLAAHPRIDPNRIAIIGFSWGGTAAMGSSLERFAKMYGATRPIAPNTPQFIAHIALYLGCSVKLGQDTQTTGKPIRFFHGTADDWTPIAPCRDYVQRLKSAGADVALTELPDAMHSFDDAALNPPLSLPNASTIRACSLEEGDNGVLVNAKSGKAFSMQDSCVEKGTHLGYNAAAYKATVEGVTQFLKITFKLQ